MSEKSNLLEFEVRHIKISNEKVELPFEFDSEYFADNDQLQTIKIRDIDVIALNKSVFRNLTCLQELHITGTALTKALL